MDVITDDLAYSKIRTENIGNGKNSTKKNVSQQQISDIIKDINNGVSSKAEEQKLETRVIKRDSAIAD